MNLAQSNTFTVFYQPYYDSYQQCYKNILTVSFWPNGPLRKITRRLQIPRLRDWSCNQCHNNSNLCQLALSNGCDWMTPDDIPNLISFMLNNGYQIETQITQMNQASNLIKNMCFTATFYGTKEPSIVYTR